MGLFVLGIFGVNLISLNLHEGTSGSIALTLAYGQEYLLVMLWGLLPFALVQMYSSTLRESGVTMVPMIAGVVAVGVNFALNYVLIFGKLGAPALGVGGAAIATVIARFVELTMIVGWTHLHSEKNPYIQGVYSSLYVPMHTAKQVIRVGFPLLLNETLWSCGFATLTQCYSVRGLQVVAAMNISNTISNVFNVIYIAMGSGAGIILGQLLGAGKLKQAKEESGTLIVLAVVLGTVFIGQMLAMPVLGKYLAAGSCGLGHMFPCMFQFRGG